MGGTIKENGDECGDLGQIYCGFFGRPVASFFLFT